MWLYQAFSVPWVQDDIHQVCGGVLPRWNGSLYCPAKIPDLIGIKDRKYIDHTATHLNRGVGDLMRYATLVSTAESTLFGPHNMLPADAEGPKARRSDEALFALSLYLQSLEPPPNPNPVDENALLGAKIFQRERCAGCHVLPLYTNNKLTLAEDFELPKNRPATLDVLPLSVRTSSGLVLKTRKGTGYYKAPSLKGVWYRGHCLHDGSVASLEEMFNPERITEAHVPGGYSPPGVKNRAIVA